MAFLNTLLALSVAFVLGTSFGFERQWSAPLDKKASRCRTKSSPAY
jgi:hypothetical protein